MPRSSSHVALALLVAACTDDIPTPLGTDTHGAGPRFNAAASAVTDRQFDVDTRDRFDIALDIHGSLKPGHPIQLTVTGRANYATDDAEIRLTLPEHAAAKRSGWDVVDLPLNQRPAAEFLLRQRFGSGETFRGVASVVFSEPGYYYVVATAQQLSDDHNFDGMAVVGTGAARGFWLWIDERGGRVTEEFDPTLFPVGTRPQRGPLGSEKKPPRLRVMCTISPDPGPGPIVMNSCTGEPPPLTPETPPVAPTTTANVTVSYTDLGASGTLRPLAEARVVAKVVDPANNAVVSQANFTTNASGQVPSIDCRTATNRLEVTVYTVSPKVEVKSYITSNPDRTLAGQYFGACGGGVALTADNQISHVFTNLTKTWDGHTRAFNLSPPNRIQAGIYGTSPYHTFYDYQHAEVHIEPGWAFDQMWGPSVRLLPRTSTGTCGRTRTCTRLPT